MSLMHSWAEPDLYIFADEQLVVSTQNVTRRLCPIQKGAEPVIVPDRPWEGHIGNEPVDVLQDPFYASVLHDPSERMFRCWYSAYARSSNRIYSPPMTSQGYACCYAVSRDGLNWEKLDTEQALYDGSLENNILRFRDTATSGTSNLGEQVWNVLPWRSQDTDDRFAATLYTEYDDPIYPRGITACFSRDGIHWRQRFPPVLPLDGDCHAVSWDPRQSCFLLTTRSQQHAHLCQRWGRPYRRHIALFKSRDLIHWTPGLTVLEVDEDDPPDAQAYLMYIFPYGHAYLGQLLMYYSHEMVLDVQLTLSHDLEHWQRVGDRQPLLHRGDKDAWDSKHVAISNNPPHPEGSRMRFWYGGKNSPHFQAGYGALGTGTLRRDGFVCYESQGEGVLTTCLFRPDRPQVPTWLLLNADASAGEIMVEAVDADGHPLPGFTRAECIPVHGDSCRKSVGFRVDAGKYDYGGNFLRFASDIRLRFTLRDAKLYAFKFPHMTPVRPAIETA